MTDTSKYAKRRQLMITRYIDWAWHFKLNGVVFVRNLETGEVKKIGKIE